MRRMPTPILHFSALQRFNADTGPGAVLAVFFAPGAEQEQAADHPDQQRLAQHPEHAEALAQRDNVVCIRRCPAAGITHG